MYHDNGIGIYYEWFCSAATHVARMKRQKFFPSCSLFHGMMLDTERNNFLSFGVYSQENETDVWICISFLEIDHIHNQ